MHLFSLPRKCFLFALWFGNLLTLLPEEGLAWALCSMAGFTVDAPGQERHSPLLASGSFVMRVKNTPFAVPHCLEPWLSSPCVQRRKPQQLQWGPGSERQQGTQISAGFSRAHRSCCEEGAVKIRNFPTRGKPVKFSHPVCFSWSVSMWIFYTSKVSATTVIFSPRWHNYVTFTEMENQCFPLQGQVGMAWVVLSSTHKKS